MSVVLNRRTHDELMLKYKERFSYLDRLLGRRPLSHPNEGCKKQTGTNKFVIPHTKPENMCACQGTNEGIRIAIGDLETILKEIKKLTELKSYEIYALLTRFEKLKHLKSIGKPTLV